MQVARDPGVSGIVVDQQLGRVAQVDAERQPRIEVARRGEVGAALDVHEVAGAQCIAKVEVDAQALVEADRQAQVEAQHVAVDDELDQLGQSRR